MASIIVTIGNIEIIIILFSGISAFLYNSAKWAILNKPYTPRCVTDYMTETTIGATCNKKKRELKKSEKSVEPVKRKDNRRKLNEILDIYRNWFLQLTICDPACGSDVFLIAALEF